MTGTTKCPKCGKSMVQGWVPDFGDYNSRNLPTWVPGAPRRTWWGGVKAPDREKNLAIAAMRCEGCGFLEFYAGAEFRPT
jgi:hypothetical protein